MEKSPLHLLFLILSGIAICLSILFLLDFLNIGFEYSNIKMIVAAFIGIIAGLISPAYRHYTQKDHIPTEERQQKPDDPPLVDTTAPAEEIPKTTDKKFKEMQEDISSQTIGFPDQPVTPVPIPDAMSDDAPPEDEPIVSEPPDDDIDLAMIQVDESGVLLPDPDSVPEKEYEFERVDIFFATDRKKIGYNKFSSELGELSFGKIQVSIPEGHRPGRLESPTIIRLQFQWDPRKHIHLLNIEPIHKDSWVEQLKKNNQETALLFIHGYNVTFENAARRTGQLKWDLGIKGPAVFYSWPSKGAIEGYAADEETVRLIEKNLFKVIHIIRGEAKVKYLNIIAHSMGCRPIMQALAKVESQDTYFWDPVILAAPDINAKIFRTEIAPKINSEDHKISIYASSNDKALKASKKIHTYPRAGEAGENLMLLNKIETIDASKVTTDFLGHGYFASSKQVIDDIFMLIQHGHPASERNLKEREREGKKYWELEA